MAINLLKPQKYEDFEIVDGETKRVGAIRVKPSGVLWQPKGKHGWFGVDRATFAAFMEKNGKEQRK